MDITKWIAKLKHTNGCERSEHPYRCSHQKYRSEHTFVHPKYHQCFIRKWRTNRRRWALWKKVRCKLHFQRELIAFLIESIWCHPLGKMFGEVQEEESSIDVSSPRDNNSPIVCCFLVKLWFRFAQSIDNNNKSLIPCKFIGIVSVRCCAKTKGQWSRKIAGA